MRSAFQYDAIGVGGRRPYIVSFECFYDILAFVLDDIVLVSEFAIMVIPVAGGNAFGCCFCEWCFGELVGFRSGLFGRLVLLCCMLFMR